MKLIAVLKIIAFILFQIKNINTQNCKVCCTEKATEAYFRDTCPNQVMNCSTSTMKLLCNIYKSKFPTLCPKTDNILVKSGNEQIRQECGCEKIDICKFGCASCLLDKKETTTNPDSSRGNTKSFNKIPILIIGFTLLNLIWMTN